MTRDQLRARIFARIDELPTLPAVVTRVLALVEDPAAGAADVTAALAKDPALTAMLLKVANSAYYGFRREVTGVDRAVALLGFHMVRSLALSIGVVQSLGGGAGAPEFSREGLWAHSLAVATALRALAPAAAGVTGDRETLFVTGLLHDVGRVALDQFFPEEFGAALAASHAEGTPLYRAEREQVGADHGEVGGILLRRWNFPEALCVPVAIHHRTPGADPQPAEVRLLRVADAVAQQAGVGNSGNPAPPVADPADRAALGLTGEHLAAAAADLEGAAASILGFAGALG